MTLMREIVAEFAISSASEMLSSARLLGDPWKRVFVEEGGERWRIPFEYALTGNNADEIKAAAEERQEMIANYS
jgi:hypothetical protein